MDVDEIAMTGFFLIRGDDPSSSERIELDGQMLVGRSDECDIRVAEGHPSRRHARLSIDASGLWVEDLASANGTRVNGREITSPTLLRSGDKVAFDLAEFLVETPAAPTETAAAGDATVVRRVVADDATVLRAPPPADTPAAASDPTPMPAAKAPPAPKSEAEALQKQVPRSWADPEFQGEGTRILSAEELRALAAGGIAAGTPVETAPAPMHTDGPHLVVLTTAGAGMVLELGGDRDEWSVGTDAEREIRLDFPGVSAFHAKISHEGGRWRVIDQMSANGTFVNGQKSTISYLQNGDKLRFAQVECEFRLPASAKASRSAARKSGQSAGRTGKPWLVAVAVAVVTGLLLLAATLLL